MSNSSNEDDSISTPHIKRSGDHSIWLKHVIDPQGDLVATLRRLEPGQIVTLRLGQQEGMWRRFQRGKDGKLSEAFNCADDRARNIWNAIPLDASVEISLVRIEAIDTAQPIRRRSKSSVARRNSDLEFTRASSRLEGEVLCIGLDIAWWGGQAGASKRQTRSECLAMATRLNGVWGELEIQRIDLTKSDNPGADDQTANADVEADLLINAISDAISRFAAIPQVVLAGDVPMMALPRPELPRPNKKKERRQKDVESRIVDYRQCDLKWQMARSNSPPRWREVPILPGAPLYPRVEKLLAKLQAIGFRLYQYPCNSHSQRTLLECFPNEVLWSAGVLGHAGQLTAASLRAYKKIGKGNVKLPTDVFLALCRQTLFPAMRSAHLDANTSDRWYETFLKQLRHDNVITDEPAEGRSGKYFDDCVDSFLALMAAVAFVDGIAHVHQGNDPYDGHIVGPGLPTTYETTSSTAAATSRPRI
jgi:hypothetical protein